MLASGEFIVTGTSPWCTQRPRVESFGRDRNGMDL